MHHIGSLSNLGQAKKHCHSTKRVTVKLFITIIKNTYTTLSYIHLCFRFNVFDILVQMS